MCHVCLASSLARPIPLSFAWNVGLASLIEVITNTRLSQTIGLEWESPGMAVRQTTFWFPSKFQVTGYFDLSSTPEAFGPRNEGQFCALTVIDEIKRQMEAMIRRFIIHRLHRLSESVKSADWLCGKNRSRLNMSPMTTQKERAEIFKSLHVKGSPVIIFNVWDVGSAHAVEQAGAKALGTGSWSVAAANGFDDGEALPLELALANIERIVNSVALPVSLDFEGGYAVDPGGLHVNITKVIAAGAIGINFEDRVVAGSGLHAIDEQSRRIEAIRKAADEADIPFYINARTDVFLETYPAKHDESQLEEALQRADAYAKAGASGLFAPGLRDPELIKSLCDRTTLPVNIMVLPDAPSNETLAELGVARISYGPGPYRQAMEAIKEAARKAFGAS
jgi:2-methylisocitrate lyase-like PEP mutase family enzyme